MFTRKSFIDILHTMPLPLLFSNLLQLTSDSITAMHYFLE